MKMVAEREVNAVYDVHAIPIEKLPRPQNAM
jgi:hypothetical protein